MEGERVYDLEQRLLKYSARIIGFTDAMPSTRAGNHIAQQVLRCGTSPLANHAEAQAAESPDDFIHKMRICLKELREARRWLLLAQCALFARSPAKVQPLIEETEELIKIFVKSIKTAQTRR
jgi:four helix bundle protein